MIDFAVEELVREIDCVVGYFVLFRVKRLEKKNRDEALKEMFHIVRTLFENIYLFLWTLKKASFMEKTQGEYRIIDDPVC